MSSLGEFSQTNDNNLYDSTRSSDDEPWGPTGTEPPRARGLSLDIAVFRLKYLFKQPCSVFCKNIYNRIPSGEAVYGILFMLGVEQIAYSAATDYMLYPLINKLESAGVRINLIRTIITYIAAFLLFPITGGLADVWVGRYAMIHFCLWLLWLSYGILAILYSISIEGWELYILPLLFTLISFGHSGFLASAIPYGADLIRYKTSQELSSYFYCYYWVRNFGLIFSLTSVDCSNLCNNLDKQYKYITIIMVSVSCITLALIANGLLKSYFTVDKERVNPYKKVVQVLYLALTIKRPLYRSAFSFSGASAPSRLNLTKKVHGGTFTSEEVEDVKTFLRLLLVLLVVLINLMLYTGVTSAIPFQLHDMNAKHLQLHFKNIPHLGDCVFRQNSQSTLVTNIGLLLLLIPILNSIIFPFFREFMPNMVKRIGIGSAMSLLSLVSALVISGLGSRRDWGSNANQQCMFSANFSDDQQCTLLADTGIRTNHTYTYNLVSGYYVIIPHVLFTLAELLVNITSLEFFYAQSPHKMRGMMIGLFFFMWGIASAMAQVLIVVFGYHKGPPLTCDVWYYLFYTILAVLGCVAYGLVARGYRNRQRGEQESVRFYRPQYNSVSS